MAQVFSGYASGPRHDPGARARDQHRGGPVGRDPSVPDLRPCRVLPSGARLDVRLPDALSAG
eukprot:2974377-Pyramimonas_sp.AAC.1